jgi:hypothetical protein
MRWEGHVAHMGDRRGAHRVLMKKPEIKRPLGRPRHRWEDNIKMDLQELGWRAYNELIWLRTGTGSCECGNEPLGSIKCRKFLD